MIVRALFCELKQEKEFVSKLLSILLFCTIDEAIHARFRTRIVKPLYEVYIMISRYTNSEKLRLKDLFSFI